MIGRCCGATTCGAFLTTPIFTRVGRRDPCVWPVCRGSPCQNSRRRPWCDVGGPHCRGARSSKKVAWEEAVFFVIGLSRALEGRTHGSKARSPIDWFESRVALCLLLWPFSPRAGGVPPPGEGGIFSGSMHVQKQPQAHRITPHLPCASSTHAILASMCVGVYCLLPGDELSLAV